MVMPVPGDDDCDDEGVALGVEVALGVCDGVAVGVGLAEVCVTVGVGDSDGRASVSNVSAASMMAFARD